MAGTTQVLEEKKATPGSGARLIRKVKRETRRRFSAEDKIRIILEGLLKEIPITDLCRREGISTAIYYSWTKQFMEGGKDRIKGATLRGATPNEVVHLRQENSQLKQLVGEQALELSLLKKSLLT
jgi:transposase